MTLDGDQKTRRGVCAASLESFIDMYGHKQLIGCVESPGWKTKFCDKHKHFIIQKEKQLQSPPNKKSKTTIRQTRSMFQKQIKELCEQLEPGEC